MRMADISLTLVRTPLPAAAINRSLSKGASEAVNRQINSIADEQPYPTDGATEESLQDVYENLRRRALVLINAGAATPQDFQGVL